MEKYPKFTIIIPQKDRAEYLVHTLRTCMLQDYPNFEVIVGDDCSEDNSVEMVRELQKKDPRIKLLAHDHHVGMRDNFELALAQVQEGYVMALGGDDGLAPGAIWRMYEILKETGAELLTWSQARFKYPLDEKDHGLFMVPRRKFKNVKMVKSSDYLNKISKGLYYMTDDCPMFYVKGVASVELVNRVKQRTPDRRFYYCPTPDGYSGVVLSGEVEEYAYTNEPLSLAGDSPKSQGRNYTRSDEQSRKEAQQFFDDNAQKTMHKELASQPYSPLIPLMTADYLLTAKDLPGWPGKFTPFTIKELLEKSVLFIAKDRYRQFATEVLARELEILKAIAIQHDELEYFNKLLKNNSIKRTKRIDVDGFLVTSNIFEFKGEDVGICNIFDAALSTKFAYRTYNQYSIRFFINWIKRSLKMYLNQFRFHNESWPKID